MIKCGPRSGCHLIVEVDFFGWNEFINSTRQVPEAAAVGAAAAAVEAAAVEAAAPTAKTPGGDEGLREERRAKNRD